MSEIVENSLYDAWNNIKKKSNTEENRVGFKEREIFWVRVGQNIGAEEFGKGERVSKTCFNCEKTYKSYFFWYPFNFYFKR